MKLIILLLALSFFGLVSSGNPGVKARISQKGLTYANSVAQVALAKQLRAMTFPDQWGSDGDIRWGVTGIRNRGVTVPTSHISFIPAHNGLRWRLTNLGVRLRTAWRILYRRGWIRFALRGSVYLKVRGINLDLALRLGKDSTGRPSVKTASCKAHVGGVDLHFRGGIGWILNMFRGPLEKRVEYLLKDQICRVAIRNVDVYGEEHLAKLKVIAEVAKGYSLDYQLTGAPIVTANSMELPMKGAVYWTQDIRDTPYTPQPIPAVTESSRMFYIWLTEYTAQTFVFASQRNDVFWSIINLDDILFRQDSSKERTNIEAITYQILGPLFGQDLGGGQASTSTSGDGEMLPQTPQHYPDHQLMLEARSKATPKVTITPQGVGLGFQVKFDIYSLLPNKTRLQLITLTKNLTADINCSIVDEKLIWHVRNYSVNFGLIRGPLGLLSSNLREVLDTVIPKIILPGANKLGAKGFDLPVTGSVNFRNTIIKLYQGALMIGADLLYTQ